MNTVPKSPSSRREPGFGAGLQQGLTAPLEPKERCKPVGNIMTSCLKHRNAVLKVHRRELAD